MPGANSNEKSSLMGHFIDKIRHKETPTKKKLKNEIKKLYQKTNHNQPNLNNLNKMLEGKSTDYLIKVLFKLEELNKNNKVLSEKFKELMALKPELETIKDLNSNKINPLLETIISGLFFGI